MAIIYSTGFQQSISNDSSKSKPVINEIEWNADYKKNKGTMNVNINKNGKKNKYQVKLKKNDLEKLLKMPAANESIDKRLKHDFIMLDSPLTTSKSKPKFIPNTFLHNNDYSDLETLFTLRKNLLHPYHLTHNPKKTTKKKANTRKKIPKKKVNKARGTRKNSSFFSNFSNML